MRIILFDIDGTLLLSGGAGQVAIETALKANFGIEQPARVAIHGQTDRGIAKSLFEKHGIEDTEDSWNQFRDDYLQHLPASLISCQGQILPGLQDMLDELHNRSDVAIGLLTGNTQRGAYRKLEHYKIAHYFAFGGFGDDHACRNDVAHSALQAAAQYLGLEPDPTLTWVIGDTPNDIKCARAIGANVIAVATGSTSVDELQSYEPTLCVSNLANWRPVLAQIMA